MIAFAKYFTPENKFVWITLLLGSTFLHFLLIQFSIGLNFSDQWYSLNGDVGDYVYSAERLLNEGNFVFSDDLGHPDKGYLYTYRTFGFAVLYLPIRLFLGLDASLKAFLILQTILNALAKYVLALITYKTFRNRNIFYFLIAVFCCSLYSSYWNNFLITESTALSVLIFGIYYWQKFFFSQNRKDLIISGLLFTLAIFLRPFLAPLLGVFSLFLLLRKPLIKGVITSFMFCLPFIAVDGLWVVRNYLQTAQFIPLSSTLDWLSQKDKVFAIQYESCSILPIFSEDWLRASPMYWFNNAKDVRDPSDLYPSSFIPTTEDKQQLIDAKRQYTTSKDPNLDLESRSKAEDEAYLLYLDLLTRFKENHPNWQLNATWEVAKAMLTPPIYSPLTKFNHPFGTRVNTIGIWIEKSINYFVFWGGLLAMFVAPFRMKKMGLIFAIIPALFLLYFVGILRLIEYRFMYIPYAFFSILACELAIAFLEQLRKTLLPRLNRKLRST